MAWRVIENQDLEILSDVFQVGSYWLLVVCGLDWIYEGVFYRW